MPADDMLQSPCKLGGNYSKSYGSDTEGVAQTAQYVIRYATRGTHVDQYIVNVLRESAHLNCQIFYYYFLCLKWSSMCVETCVKISDKSDKK